LLFPHESTKSQATDDANKKKPKETNDKSIGPPKDRRLLPDNQMIVNSRSCANKVCVDLLRSFSAQDFTHCEHQSASQEVLLNE